MNVYAVLAGILLIASSAAAQYAHLPTANTTDGRFLSIAGTGIQTLGDNTIIFKIGLPSTATNLEIGFFDGETGGVWDQGTTPLTYTLFADPTGDATGTLQISQWNGANMTDTTWYNTTTPVSSSARCGDGDYYYVMRVQSSNPATFHWSSFKVRTNGSIVILRNTNFSYTAPMGTLLDAKCVYPTYPTLGTSTYDGQWNFYMAVPTAQTSISVWDGDADRGSFDCSDNDVDDQDTPNGAVPGWANASAIAEGVATSPIACTDAAGVVTTGMATSNPPDDSRNPIFKRGPHVSYTLTTPDGSTFENTNPSGNMEWEQFRVSTEAFDRNLMDHHADALPAGVYRVQISGVDLSNLNAWRMPFDVTGVDASGVPVPPISTDYTNGSIIGLIYYEGSGNTTQDAGEPGIPSITVILLADYNGDGTTDATFTTETAADGSYSFSGLRKGNYVITVDAGTLADDAVPVWDTDSTITANSVSGNLTSCVRIESATFGYKRTTSTGTRTRGYWVNHPETWPVSTLKLGSVYYTKTQLLDILEQPTRGDKTYALSAQLIATKLNIAAGCDPSCIAQTVIDADAWLVKYPLGSKVKGGHPGNASGDALLKKLDDYNNGRLCVGHVN